jgi:hypothetical protein
MVWGSRIFDATYNKSRLSRDYARFAPCAHREYPAAKVSSGKKEGAVPQKPDETAALGGPKRSDGSGRGAPLS